MISDQLSQLEHTLKVVSQTHRSDFIIDAAQKILTLDASHEQAHFRIVFALYNSQQFDLMFEAIQAAHPYVMNSDWIHYAYYLYYLTIGGQEYLKAKEHIETAIRISPQKALYHRSLGEVYLINREPNKAIEPLQTAVHLMPTHAEYRSRLALALLRAKKVDTSLKMADLALKDGVNEPWVFDSVGMIYTLTGDLDHGETLFREALRMDPVNDYFQKHIDWVIREKENKNFREKQKKIYTPLYLRQTDTRRFF